MAILEFTTSNALALGSATLAISGGSYLGASLVFRTKDSDWAPLFTESGYWTMENGTLGKKYSQHLVHNYGSYNYFDKWVYSDDWWKQQYEKVKNEIPTSVVEEIKKSVDAYYPYSGLSSACTSLFGVKISEITNLEAVEKDLWKFCSPVGYKPYNLENSNEYYEYCGDNKPNQGTTGHNKDCIINDEERNGSLKTLLASTGRGNPSSSNEDFKKLRSNDYFWYMRNQWYNHQIRKDVDYIEYQFRVHVDAVNKDPSSFKLDVTKDKVTLRHVCDAAYRLKALNKTPLSRETLIKFCGVASDVKLATSDNVWRDYRNLYHGLVGKSGEAWGSLYNSKQYFNLRTYHNGKAVGNKYAQHLVHYYGAYDQKDRWVYTDQWWRQHYEAVKDDLAKAEYPFFRNTRGAPYPYYSLALSCDALYWRKMESGDNPSDKQKDHLWKFCSPLRGEPVSLKENTNYSNYCQNNSTSGTNCITNSDGNDLKNLLAYTGKGIVASNSEELRKVNAFWAMRQVWLEYQTRIYPQSINQEFKNHMKAVEQNPNSYLENHSSYKPLTMKEYCEAAYLAKTKSKTPLSRDVLIKFCGIPSVDFYK